MNNLTARNRKIIYAVGILVLLAPIVYLGAPVSEDIDLGQGKKESGGALARMRIEYDLGEATLGEIDATSAALNLVLLGLRGPAAGYLHMEAVRYQERKDWARLKSTVESIIKLQPHYVKIWEFQGWNLAFNVSREWDRAADRFFWVKEGVKFLQTGTNRNQTSSLLAHNVGDFLGRKFGMSDEKRYFRKWFLNDPDLDEWNGGADSVINPDSIDNFLMARRWFQQANEKADMYGITGKAPLIFKQGPARALLDYGNALQEDGRFDDASDEWGKALTAWKEEYGGLEFYGLYNIKYKLENGPGEIERMADENGVNADRQRLVVQHNQEIVNYTFWKALAECENDPDMAATRKTLGEAKQAWANAETSEEEVGDGVVKPSKAELKFWEAMEGMQTIMDRYQNKGLDVHVEYIEDSMLAVFYYQQIRISNGHDAEEGENAALPAEFPLKKVWEENQGLIPQIRDRFARGL